MAESKWSRRQLLGGAAALVGAGLVRRAAAAPQRQTTPPLSAAERSAVELALGKKGSYNDAEAVHTVALPRADLKVAIQRHAVPTAFGFGGWVSFKHTLDGRSAVIMSDAVLLQDEVNPLISAVQNNGLGITAIHNHFFYEDPRVFFMHIHGMGPVADLAAKYAAAIKDTKLFPANQPPAGPPPAKAAKDLFDLNGLDDVVKHHGAVNGAVYKYVVGRPDLTVLCMGAEFTAAIGLNTWAAFAGDEADAAMAGDVAMLETEVNLVVHALRQHNLEVVALHHHMLGEQPRVIFLHYYGRGRAQELARGFRAALDVLGQPAGAMDMPPM